MLKAKENRYAVTCLAKMEVDTWSMLQLEFQNNNIQQHRPTSYGIAEV